MMNKDSSELALTTVDKPMSSVPHSTQEENRELLRRGGEGPILRIAQLYLSLVSNALTMNSLPDFIHDLSPGRGQKLSHCDSKGP